MAVQGSFGLTGTTMKDAPSNSFFLEYITRPQTKYSLNCLMACVFLRYANLIENNKTRFLLHFRNGVIEDILFIVLTNR
jgi:hypothetical protein